MAITLALLGLLWSLCIWFATWAIVNPGSYQTTFYSLITHYQKAYNRDNSKTRLGGWIMLSFVLVQMIAVSLWLWLTSR